MDLHDFDSETPDDFALLSDEQRNLLAQYWDDNEPDNVNRQVILHWLRYPEIPDRV